jgi:hypothetical protein
MPFLPSWRLTETTQLLVGFIGEAEISSGIEVELNGWHRPRLCKRFYVHHLYGETNILKVYVSVAQVFRSLQKDYIGCL